MSKNKYVSEIERIEKTHKKLDDYTAKVQCECYHHGRDNMSPSLIKVKTTGDGKNKYVFKCLNCKKLIDLRSVDEKTREDAFRIVDNMVDLIKMQLDPNKEEDAKLLVNLARFQFRLERKLESAYRVIVLGQGKKKKKKNNDNRDSSSFWAKSVIR